MHQHKCFRPTERYLSHFVDVATGCYQLVCMSDSSFYMQCRDSGTSRSIVWCPGTKPVDGHPTRTSIDELQITAQKVPIASGFVVIEKKRQMEMSSTEQQDVISTRGGKRERPTMYYGYYEFTGQLESFLIDTRIIFLLPVYS
jgi:hypothetical protein